MALIGNMPPKLSDALNEKSAHPMKDALLKILYLLKSHTGHDFSHYKSNTICRRIERRMQACKINDVYAYADFLKQGEEELNILLSDLLIGVTSFFRDVEAYHLLGHYIEQQIRSKKEVSCYRVWVPACSTGEEAYSICILIKEIIDRLDQNIELQIFASDIDDNAIKIARAGIYPLDALESVSQERLNRCFTKIGNEYRINRDVRDHIVFAAQSVIKDPPFTRIDFLSCRNLLIYFGLTLQKKILPLFHYSLNPGGLLFLGASESIGGYSEYFETLDKKNKIYQRKDFKSFNEGKVKFPITDNKKKSRKNKLSSIEKPAFKEEVSNRLEQVLVENCIPPCVITDKSGNIIYVHGSTGNYIEHASGSVSLNVVDMARSGLDTKISYAIREVNSGNSPYSYANIKLSEPCESCLNLIVKSVYDGESERDLIVIIFEEMPLIGEIEQENAVVTQDDPRLIELERELKYTKESLQSSIEELKSTNEELQSTNEELQSTNEELETSKEELVTVNAELECRIEELTNANDDIKNLLDSTSIATLFLSNNLSIKRFTPKSQEIIRLITSDVGRPIYDIMHNLKSGDHFIQQIETVCKTGIAIKDEIKDKKGQWYHMRITPYQTISGMKEGVVVTFENITEIKRHREHLETLVSERTAKLQEANNKLKDEIKQHKLTEEALVKSESKFEHLFNLNIMGIFTLDNECNLLTMNSAFSKIIGYKKNDLPIPIKKLIADGSNATLLRFEKNISPVAEHEYIRKDGSKVCLLQGGIAVNGNKRIFFTMDMTKYKMMEDELHQYQQRHANITRINTAGEMATGIAHEVNQPLANITNYIHGLQLRLESSDLDRKDLIEILGKISQEAKRSSAIVKNMRRLVHKKPGEYEDIDVNSIVLDVVKNQKKELDNDKIKVDTLLDNDLPKITMNKIQFEQVLINLINNSRDSLSVCKEGERNIRIKSVFNDSVVKILIEDNGKIIERDEANQIFDLFYTTKSDGLGMGLSISRSIIESYGGQLNYVSDINGCNIFEISVPINKKPPS